MTAAFNLNAIAQLSTLRIVDCLVEGTLITIFAGLVLRTARLRSSSARFAVWFSALLALAALPLLGAAPWSHAGIPAQSLNWSAITLPGYWALYLFGAWAVIAAFQLAGVGRGLWHLHVLRKSCVPLDPAVFDARLQETLARSQSARPVSLCTSDRVHVPTAIGLVKPAVVLPGWVLQELSPDELNQILLHELEHLRRWDDWTNLTQKVVKALFFFHPAVWWIEKRVSLEREMACDDAVLAETASPRAYAECLAHLAEKTLVQRSVALAQAALGRIRQTSLRVAQILDANRPAITNSNSKMRSAWKPAVSLVAGFAIVCVLGISRAPKLVAFRDVETRPAAGSTVASGSAASSHSLSGVAPTLLAHTVPAKAIPEWQPVRVVQASLREPQRTPDRIWQRRARAVALPAKLPQPPTADLIQPNLANPVPENLVHQTSLTNANPAPVAFIETFLVIVEGHDNGFSDRPVFQIQLWRLTVLHPVVDADGNRIPPKQT
jgi:beta-lactamase regulating signal transducer with metallopeptidase domain